MSPGIPFDKKLIGKTYLVTGVTGFIGGRIVERICRDYKARVKALVHNLGHAARIARFDIELLQGDILNKEWVDEITEDVDYVIHCAFGNSSDHILNRKITIGGTENIAQASFHHKVRRFIYFSTMSVYGSPLPVKCNELSPYKRVPYDHYNNDKIEAEQIVYKYIKKGLSGVLLQPTIVYGPYASAWTQWVVHALKEKQLFLTDDGKGLANPVYIDNVIDAVFLSMIKDQALGEKFIISDGITITWKIFFNLYQQMINNSSILKLGKYLKYKYLFLTILVDTIKKFKNRIYSGPIFTNKNILTKSFDSLSQDTAKMKTALDKNLERFFNDRCLFEIYKAQEKLDYFPRISFKKGMELTQKWLKYSRLI